METKSPDAYTRIYAYYTAWFVIMYFMIFVQGGSCALVLRDIHDGKGFPESFFVFMMAGSVLGELCSCWLLWKTYRLAHVECSENEVTFTDFWGRRRSVPWESVEGAATGFWGRLWVNSETYVLRTRSMRFEIENLFKDRTYLRELIRENVKRRSLPISADKEA